MAYIGNGTINDPYLIDNITDFGIVLYQSGFGGNSNTRYIKLIADLEFNTMGLIGDYIFSVEGLDTNTVNIDGDGHWIRNHTRFYNNVLYGYKASKIIFNNIKMSIYDLSTSTLPFIQRSNAGQQIYFNRCVLYIYSTNPNGIVFHANTVTFSSVLLRFNLSYIKIFMSQKPHAPRSAVICRFSPYLYRAELCGKDCFPQHQYSQPCRHCLTALPRVG